MRPTQPARVGFPSWDIAVPSRPSRLAGVTMAGFSDETNDLLEVALVPHPAVTILFDLGDTPILIDDGHGAQHRERVVAGLAPVGARGRGSAGGFACLQVRLSPLVAEVVLGASSELGGKVAALDHLWGHEARSLRARRFWPSTMSRGPAGQTRYQNDILPLWMY